MRSFPARLPVGLLAILLGGSILLAGAPHPAAAQLPASGEWRFGARLGGTGSISLVAEYFWDDERSVEAALGTISFRNLTLAGTVHQYLGSDSFRPMAGAGFWIAGGLTEEGVPIALLFRAPLGFDWQADGEHYVSADITLIRGIAVRRPAPGDDRPLSGGWVPLPSLTYWYLAR